MAKIIIQFIIYTYIIYLMWDIAYKYTQIPPVKTFRNNFKQYNGVLYFLFDLLPKRLAEWICKNTDSNFDEYGLILFCGPQGQGKTYSMIHEATKIQARFPECKVYGNLWAIINDYQIDNWQQLIYAENGEKGLIFIFDEISLWWNSRFRDLNPLVLQELVQNRKNRRVIFGSCQNISMCDKQIRLQCTEFRNVHCLFSAFVFCTCWQPTFDMTTGDLKEKKFVGIKFYAQDDAIRYSYDTFQTIKTLAESGFNYDIQSDPHNIDIYTGGGNNEKIKRKR